jgi:hypothetical protein
MSYDPQSGGSTQPQQPPEEQGRYTPPETPGGQPTMPVGGTPTQPSGGYTPPPGGGYTPPPPPPPGSGYGAPPPPPTTPTGGMDQAGLQGLFQSYMNAVTKPNVGTYEAEIPNASWTKVLIGVGIVAVVSFLVNLIFAGAAAAQLNAFRDQFEAQGTDLPFDPAMFAGGTGVGGAVIGLFLTFITFLLGTAIQYGIARMQGGQGADFMTQAYLSSLSYTPLRTVGAILNIIPVIGGLIGFVLTLYQVYSVGLSLQASQRLTAGKAQLAAWLPLVIGLVLICGCALLAVFGLAAALSGASNP